MDHGREGRVVVGGDVLGDAAGPLGRVVDLGSVPPTYQNTEGTPHSLPKDPKSSLAEIGAASSCTRSVPKRSRSAAATRCVRSGR